jgi:hypothetical protein
LYYGVFVGVLEEARVICNEVRDERVPVIKQHVHKTFDKNRLLTWLKCESDELGQQLYTAKVRVLADHAYFFEHDRRHLPGLYIIEAGRQLGLAVPHIFLDVGFDYAFVLDGCDMSFSGFANLSDDLFIQARALNPIYRKGHLQSVTFDGTFIQNDVPLVRYQSHIRLIHERLLRRYEQQNG